MCLQLKQRKLSDLLYLQQVVVRNGRTSHQGGPNTSAPLRSPAVTKLVNSYNAVMNPSGKTSHDLLAVALHIKLRKQYLQPSKNLLYVMKTLWLLGPHSIICVETGMNKCVISLQNIVDKQESVNLLSHALTAIMRSITLTP